MQKEVRFKVNSFGGSDTQIRVEGDELIITYNQKDTPVSILSFSDSLGTGWITMTKNDSVNIKRVK